MRAAAPFPDQGDWTVRLESALSVVPRARLACGQGPDAGRRRKRRREEPAAAAPSTRARRQRRAVSYEEDPDFEL